MVEYNNQCGSSVHVMTEVCSWFVKISESFFLPSSQIVEVAVSERMLPFAPRPSDSLRLSGFLHGKRAALRMRSLFQNMARASSQHNISSFVNQTEHRMA